MLLGKILKIIFCSPVYAQNGKLVIGNGNDMPWRGLIPSDMARFKTFTSMAGENSVIIGRKTWDYAIPEKFRPFDKELPPEKARQTIVVTRKQDFRVDDARVLVAHSLEEAVEKARSGIVWIAGGAEIYALALPRADYIYQTVLQERFSGDAFFPPININEWKSIFWEYYQAGKDHSANDKVNSGFNVLQRIW